jgi:hypothetical protein
MFIPMKKINVVGTTIVGKASVLACANSAGGDACSTRAYFQMN